MAAAYASIITLNFQIIEQVQLHHNRRRKPSYWEEQLKQVDSLNQITTFFQEFLEKNSNNNELMELLENRIRAIADEAQDIIESYMVEYSKSSSVEEYISSEQSFNGLDDVIEDMNSLKEEVIKIKDGLQPQDLVHPAGSSGPSASREVNTPTMEDDGQLLQILDKLTRGQSDLLTLPISGMGGIGKTTLAKKVFDHPFRKSFDVCAWATISQVYNVEAVLLVLAKALTNESNLRRYNWHQLGEKLHKHLKGRKFLIVMDDVWDTDIWDKLKRFIPDNNNGSRILVTTRLLNVADYVNLSGLYEMDFLDENESWSLLCRKAFGQEGCPYPELEEIAKRIAENCKGLPLSIIVIAGLLAKSNLTRELLELIVNDTNQIINSEESGVTLRMLLLSYNHLPIHLKPCLLYMGSYREDQKIHITTLINLWVAEGFLKPMKPKTMEDVAEDYLKDLIERNLVMVGELGSTGKIKYCIIHDLVRDLCLKESNRGEFLCFTKIIKDEVPFEVYEQQHRRIVLHHVERKDLDDGTKYVSFFEYLKSIPRTRSLSYRNCPYVNTSKAVSDNLKLLKVFSLFDPSTSHLYNYERIVHTLSSMELYNLRYIDTYLDRRILPLNKIRNLLTICIIGYYDTVMLDIWRMLELRHLKSNNIYLSDPSLCGLEEEHVLENLQTLTGIKNVELTEEFLTRIPNVKKLGLCYDYTFCKNHSFDSLNCLHKLKSLKVIYSGWGKFHISVFPPTLKRLHLEDCCCNLDYVISKIGQLPNLEKLTLIGLRAKNWSSVEGQFISLKYLHIQSLSYGKLVWTSESGHFPALESLVIANMSLEIPFDFAYSTTLRSIHLVECEDSRVLESAREILEEQKILDTEKGIRLTEEYESDDEIKACQSMDLYILRPSSNDIEAWCSLS